MADRHAGVDDLLDHLERTSGLGRSALGRLVDEVVAYFAEPLERFVTRRHAELQADDLRNDAIFERIAAELAARRFPGPALTARQLRRMIYG